MGVVGPPQHDIVVAVNEVEQPSGPHEKTAHRPPAIDGLALVGDDAGPAQLGDDVGDHAGVDAQVPVA